MDGIDYNIENTYHAAEMLPFERKILFNWIINNNNSVGLCLYKFLG